MTIKSIRNSHNLIKKKCTFGFYLLNTLGEVKLENSLEM